MRQAADIARASGGSMTLLHVVHIPLMAYGEGAPMMPSSGFTLEREMGAEADKHLASWKQRAEEMGVRTVSTKVVSGVPWHEIVEVARRDPGYDMVVLGTQGRTGLSHILLGSVAERVVRHAPCPVLVVRARRHDEPGTSSTGS
jgi:nucleotide-binding universal stress UspA family protein